MNTPFGMVGAALLFWGWQTGWLPLALSLAIAIEARVLWRPALTLDAQAVNRFADLSSLALIAVGAWLLVTLEAPRAGRTVIGMAQWLPLTLAPLAIVQAYLVRAPLDVSALFITLRTRRPTGMRVDMGFMYVIACVLAASTANVRNEMFYAGAAVFASWSLWNLRSRRYHRTLAFAMLMGASVLGYAGHLALNQFQGALSEWVGELLDRSVDANPFRTHSQIGQIGALKLSDRIVMRVHVPARSSGELQEPLLLHRASYNVFFSPSWIARPVNFDPLPGDAEQGWSLRAMGGTAGSATVVERARERAVEVIDYARNGKTILALPTGTVFLDGLPPAELRRSGFGSTNVDTVPGFLRYRAYRGEGASVESPPAEADYAVPARERDTLRAVAAELGLHGADPREALRMESRDALRQESREALRLDPREARRRIERFFAEKFRYTTWLQASSPQVPTALGTFLTRTRAGHCEYFASATVLLLREAGIAARYATGFSVQERGTGEEFVVRERHAHAWTRAWIDGAWVDIDTTPPQWFAVEGGEAALTQWFTDAWSWLRFAWGRYQTSDDDTVSRPLLIGLLVVLFAWLAWRIFHGPGKRVQALAGVQGAVPVAGADSEFYRIERLLAARNLGRDAAEPLTAWLPRLAKGGIDADRIDDLRAIVRLHYRLRFDPVPMAPELRAELRSRVERWLQWAQASPQGAGAADGHSA